MIEREMNNGACSVELCGEAIELLPSGCAWWSRERVLFVADVHLGKSATFRASGLPVPDSCAHDLERLARCIAELGVVRLVVLGDLLHARAGRTGSLLRTMDEWRERHRAVEILLIRGNHDRSSGDPPAEWGIEVQDNGYTLGPFGLWHEPPSVGETPADQFVLCGHVHPAVRVGAVRGGREDAGKRFPAFVSNDSMMILPAFGSFTGAKSLQRRAWKRVFVLVDDEVLELS